MITGIVAAQMRLASASSYWIDTFGASGNESSAVSSPVIDASGNIYATGLTASIGAGSNDLILFKMNSAGSLLWQRTLGGTVSDNGAGVALDSSGNVYVVGSVASQGAGSNDLLLAKYSSTGVIQWQRSLGGSSSDFGSSIAISSSDAIYVVGSTDPGAGAGDMLLARYNTSGTLQWKIRFGGSGGVDAAQDVAVDSAGSVYVCGYSGSTGSGSIDAIIAKFDNTGAIQWQRGLSGSGFDYFYGIVADAFGGVCVTGYTDSQGAGGTDLLLARYNTSGTLKWQRSLGGTGSDFGFRVSTDSTGAFYVAGRSNGVGAGLEDLLLAKYSNSGAIQWQRSLGGTNYEYGTGIAVGPTGEMCVLGRTESTGAGGQDILLARLPVDGTLTGTYGSLTYASTSLTDAARTLTGATPTLEAGSPGLTDSARTLTDAAGTLTLNRVAVP